MQFLEKPLCPIRHLNPDRFLNEIGSQLHQCFMDGIPEPEIIRSDPTKAQILLPSQDRRISFSGSTRPCRDFGVLAHFSMVTANQIRPYLIHQIMRVGIYAKASTTT